MTTPRRWRYNNEGGTLDVQLNAAGTTMSSPALANFPAITAPDYAVVVLDPEGLNGLPEIVYITAHTAAATTATVTRVAEGSSTGNVYGTAGGRTHPVATKWWHGPVASDLEANLVDGTTITSAGGALQVAPHGVDVGQLATHAFGDGLFADGTNPVIVLVDGTTIDFLSAFGGKFVEVKDGGISTAKIANGAVLGTKIGNYEIAPINIAVGGQLVAEDVTGGTWGAVVPRAGNLDGSAGNKLRLYSGSAWKWVAGKGMCANLSWTGSKALTRNRWNAAPDLALSATDDPETMHSSTDCFISLPAGYRYSVTVAARTDSGASGGDYGVGFNLGSSSFTTGTTAPSHDHVVLPPTTSNIWRAVAHEDDIVVVAGTQVLTAAVWSSVTGGGVLTGLRMSVVCTGTA